MIPLRHNSATDDDAAQSFADGATTLVRKYQTKNGGEDLGIIPNYTSGKIEPSEVWGSSYNRLREVKVSLTL